MTKREKRERERGGRRRDRGEEDREDHACDSFGC